MTGGTICIILRTIFMGLSSVAVFFRQGMEILGYVSTGFTLIGLIGYVCSLSFAGRLKEETENQIRVFTKVKKYEPSLFVELNENMEHLRYFLFAYKWKKRVIYQYNMLFDSYEGKRIKEKFEIEHKRRIACFTKMSKIKELLSKLDKCFETIKKERNHLEKQGQYAFIASLLAHQYQDVIKYLIKCSDMIINKAILLKGSAGNGKTNLMCRISEIAILNRYPVLLINSRDIINNDCTEYILNKINLGKLKDNSKLYLSIVSLFLRIRRKHILIIIDAINENDSKAFINTIGKTIDFFSKYSRIRILLSCRSEYFDSRYYNYFKECNSQPYIFEMADYRYGTSVSVYNRRATLKMFKTYQKYFNVKGIISQNVKEKLLGSLFLMRIFFEVNKNSDKNIMQLRNYEIYLQYLEQVSSEIKIIDFKKRVDEIAGIMIDRSDYNHVAVDCLNITDKNKSAFFQVLDNNLIISRNLITGSGITKKDNEVVCFVFDEFRDFCLARYLLDLSEKEQDSEYNYFFSKVNEMFSTRQSPVEGIIKYGYYHFKFKRKANLIKKILDLYGESDVQKILDSKDWRIREHRVFRVFGLSLIFIDGGDVAESEIEFLKEYIDKDSRNYWNFFRFLLSNEYSNLGPRLDLGMKLLEYKTIEEMSKIFEYLFEYEHFHSQQGLVSERKVDNLCKWLRIIKKKNGYLSEHLKSFLVLLCAIVPQHDYALYKYKQIVLEDEVYTYLQESIKCPKVRKTIQLYREKMRGKPVD
jgi:hypothetical protein